jgi:microcystin-dependent protein
MSYTDPRTWVTGEVVTAAMMNTHIRDNLDALASVGSYKLIAGEPSDSEEVWDSGWLECNGVGVSRSTYSDLFDYLDGLTNPLPFGVGDGSTTFNVPDLRGRVPMHVDTAAAARTGSKGDALGETGGDHDHVLSTGEMPSHNHSGATGGQSASHTHTVPGVPGDNASAVTGGGAAVRASQGTPITPGTTGTSNDHTHGINSEGGGGAHENLPPFLAAGVWLIKF